MTRALHILVTGEPLPVTRELRGGFGALIRGVIAGEWSGQVREVDGRGGDALPELEQVAGLIITGSSASVTSREPWMLRLEEYLRSAVAAETPIFGICFGHQLLGQALGGQVEKNPQGREIGTVKVDVLKPDPLLGSDQSFFANSTHVDSVVTPPPGAVVLGRTELEPNAVLRFSERAFGVQFHPEVDGEVMLHYVNSRRQLLTEEGFDPDGMRERIRDCPKSAEILKRFVRSVCY